MKVTAASEIDKSSDEVQTVLAQICLSKKAKLNGGSSHPTKRWIGDVVDKEVTWDFLWALHVAGIVRLSRMDLPQVWEGGLSARAYRSSGAMFNFVEAVR